MNYLDFEEPIKLLDTQLAECIELGEKSNVDVTETCYKIKLKLKSTILLPLDTNNFVTLCPRFPGSILMNKSSSSKVSWQYKNASLTYIFIKSFSIR